MAETITTKLRRLNLPAFEQESSYQEKVDQQKEILPVYIALVKKGHPKDEAWETIRQGDVSADLEIVKLTQLAPGELGRFFVEFDAELDALEEKAKVLRIKRLAIEQELLKAMEDDDLQSFKLTDGTLLFQQADSYASVENKDLLMGFVKREKLIPLLNLPWQSLNSITKERIMDGQAPPPGVKVFIKTSVRKRRA